MVGQFFIAYLILLYHFFGARFYGTYHTAFLSIKHPLSVNTKKRLIKLDVLTVHAVQVGFTHAQVVNCIKNIGFTHAILSYYGIYITA
jgi:hypothetical protein